MKQNMDTMDRIIRFFLAVAIALLYWQGIITGAEGILILIMAILFFTTRITGYCPLYALLSINTNKRKHK